MPIFTVTVTEARSFIVDADDKDAAIAKMLHHREQLYPEGVKDIGKDSVSINVQEE